MPRLNRVLRQEDEGGKGVVEGATEVQSGGAEADALQREGLAGLAEQLRFVAGGGAVRAQADAGPGGEHLPDGGDAGGEANISQTRSKPCVPRE